MWNDDKNKKDEAPKPSISPNRPPLPAIGLALCDQGHPVVIPGHEIVVTEKGEPIHCPNCKVKLSDGQEKAALKFAPEKGFKLKCTHTDENGVACKATKINLDGWIVFDDQAAYEKFLTTTGATPPALPPAVEA